MSLDVVKSVQVNILVVKYILIVQNFWNVIKGSKKEQLDVSGKLKTTVVGTYFLGTENPLILDLVLVTYEPNSERKSP